MIGGHIIQHVPRGESPAVPTPIERYLDWQRRYHASTTTTPSGNTYFSGRMAMAQVAG